MRIVIILFIFVSVGAMSVAAGEYQISPEQSIMLKRIDLKRWVPVHIDDVHLVSFDKKTGKYLGKRIYQVWFRWDTLEDQDWQGQKYDHITAKTEINCETLETRHLNQFLYKGDVLVHLMDKKNEWATDVPDSIGEYAHRRACDIFPIYFKSEDKQPTNPKSKKSNKSNKSSPNDV